LRAAISLAKLLKDTPKRDESFDILDELVNWFKEGLELPDILEARDLLRKM
jgi:hypothetical protein